MLACFQKGIEKDDKNEAGAGNSVASQHDDSWDVSSPQETPIHASNQAAEQETSIGASMHATKGDTSLDTSAISNDIDKGVKIPAALYLGGLQWGRSQLVILWYCLVIILSVIILLSYNNATLFEIGNLEKFNWKINESTYCNCNVHFVYTVLYIDLIWKVQRSISRPSPVSVVEESERTQSVPNS